MSARGWLVTNPNQKSSEIISEAKRYIPLAWFGLPVIDDRRRDCKEREEDGRIVLDRKAAIENAESSLPFLADVFSDMRVFEESARDLLKRLKRLRCKTIGIDVTELVETHLPPNPNLWTAIETIGARDASFKLSLPAKTVANPFSGEEIRIKARKITSTREMLLDIAWLTPGESLVMPRNQTDLKDDECRELVTGYVWE